MKKVACITAVCLCMASLAQAVLVDNDFGTGTDTGPAFQQLSNGNGGSSYPATGVIANSSTISDATGFNTTGTVDASGEEGFTITWTVSSCDIDDLDADIWYNGWFFGVTTSTDSSASGLWNNAPNPVGVLIESDSYEPSGDWHLVAGHKNTRYALSGSQPTLASLQDGFAITLTVNSHDTYTVSSN